MSWMDSWSRPNKSQATPPPFYLTHGDDVPYCHTCGRVIGSRRTKESKTSNTAVKYCSDKCKRHKPSKAADSLDIRIEQALLCLLENQDPSPYSLQSNDSDGPTNTAPKPKPHHQPPKKGDPRLIIPLSALETAIFGERSDPTKIYGRRKNRAARGVPSTGEWKSVDMEDRPTNNSYSSDDDERQQDGGNLTEASLTDGSLDGKLGGVSLNDHIRLPQTESDVNFSVGGERGKGEKIDETPEMLAKRLEGQKRAEEKELVKKVARRAVAFGLEVEVREVVVVGKKGRKGPPVDERGEEGGGRKGRRKCEALMNGQVVEPSFAKGDWSIRWRED